MQITIEDVSPVERRVEFEVPWSDVAPRLDRAYGKLRQEVHLKGFRPGKTPRAVLERMYRHRVEDDVAREIIEMALSNAIRENQIEPVAPPTVDKIELSSGKPFKFSAKVEIRSQVTPKDYGAVPVSRRPPKVTDLDVAAALETVRRRHTEIRPIEGRDVLAGTDVVVAELHGEVGPHHIHKTGKEAMMLDLSDEPGPLPGLLERLRGLPATPGKHKLAWTVPADAPQKELAGQDAKIEVTIKEAREKKVPALDDELAKDTGEAETLEALKAKIRDQLKADDEKRIEREMKQALIKEVVKRNPFPIASGLVDRHAQAMLNRGKAQLYMAGIDVENANLDEEKMLAGFRSEAEEEARGTILLQAIAEREGLGVDDAEVQKRIAELAAARRENPRKLRQDYEKDGRLAGLRMQLLEEKTLAMLLAQATITDVDPERLIVTPDEARAEKKKGKGSR